MSSVQSKWSLPSLAVAATCLLTSETAVAAEQVFGVIEIGGKGVKASVFRIDPAEAKIAAVVDAQDAKLNLLEKASFHHFKEIQTAAVLRAGVPQTVAAVREFQEEINERFKPAALYIVAASGVASVAHFSELKASIEQTTKLKLDAVDAAQECSLGFRWAIPQSHRADSVFVDIGSGNTTACYEERGGLNGARMHAFELLPYGTVTFAQQAAHRASIQPGQVLTLKQAREVRDSDLTPILQEMREAHVGLLSKRRLYLGGGASWMFAAVTHPGQEGANAVRLSPGDVETWGRYLDETIECTSPQLIQRPHTQIGEVCDVFSRPQRVAAFALVTAINRELRGLCKFNDCKETVEFTGASRSGWRSEYLVEKVVNSALPAS